MNMLRKNRSAFTLIEIIVTIVIVGVLVGFALPNMWSNVKRQQGQEAINTMTMMRSSMEACAIANNNDLDGGNCDTWSNLNMSNPSTTKFTYTWEANDNNGTAVDWATGSYAMKAVSSDGEIWMIKNAGAMSCVATGAYQGLC